MPKKYQPVYFLLIVAAIFSTALLVIGQPTKQPGSSPEKNVRNVKSEANEAYKKWLLDVGYIMTPDEKRAYSMLNTDEEREKFIGIFWDKRDPDPDTEENEYREAYYERIAYANEHFSSGVPGWKTDRGRIYITWGKPDEIDGHPSGGSYDKQSYEGGGSATTFPFETWFYRHLDNVGDGVEIEFVDQTGSGEYRLARDINEKYLTLGPSQGLGADRNSYVREQDSPFAANEKLRNLNMAPPVRASEIDRILTEGPIVDKNPLGIAMQIAFFRQSDTRVIASVTIQADNKDLQFSPDGAVSTARLNVLGRLTSVAGRRVGTFEDSVVTSATNAELTAVRNRRSVYQRTIALVPGYYKADVEVRDITSGNKGVVHLGFAVPKYEPGKLSTSSLVLASTLRATNQNETGDRFVIGGTKLIPNLSGVYKRGEPVGVYLQLYNAGIDQTTLRPSVDVDYVVMKNGLLISCVTEDWSGMSDSSQRLTLARLLPTSDLEPGDYELRIVTKDHVAEAQHAIENKASFTVTK